MLWYIVRRLTAFTEVEQLLEYEDYIPLKMILLE